MFDAVCEKGLQRGKNKSISTNMDHRTLWLLLRFYICIYIPRAKIKCSHTTIGKVLKRFSVILARHLYVLNPFCIYQRALLILQCSDIINSKLACGSLTFKNPRSSIGLKIRSDLKVLFLPLGPPCPLQPFCIFFYLKRAKQPLLSVAGCHTRPRKFKF
jgi:hypothetical protein